MALPPSCLRSVGAIKCTDETARILGLPPSAPDKSKCEKYSSPLKNGTYVLWRRRFATSASKRGAHRGGESACATCCSVRRRRDGVSISTGVRIRDKTIKATSGEREMPARRNESKRASSSRSRRPCAAIFIMPEMKSSIENRNTSPIALGQRHHRPDEAAYEI